MQFLNWMSDNPGLVIILIGCIVGLIYHLTKILEGKHE